jgi:RND superfamily putative drug exporter
VVTSGVDEMPQDLPIIKTYHTVKNVFPSEGVTATVAVQADHVRSGATAAGIAALRSRVDASKSFLPGTEVTSNAAGTVAKIEVPTPGNGTDKTSLNSLNELRDTIIPATLGRVDGTTVDVSGDAASSKDFADQLTSRLPLIFAFVFGLAFILLLLTFRSIVIPIKAIILNLLSIGAAYGILVLIFQDGHLESLVGFTSIGGVTNWLPLFLFVVLFGLSMDYHVFILSRVRELYDRGLSTDEAVKQGIATTAGTVTAAATVMVGVFAVFATLSFLDFKELGIGMAVAVLIDATIIRGILLPASMKLLGDWNWYLPSWLEWLPRIGAGRDVLPPHGPDEPPAPDGAGASDEPRPAPVPA